jgi:hypothetical protein
VTAPERWLPAPDWEGLYEVSDFGRVRSLDRMVRTHHDGRRLVRGRMLKPQPSGKYGHLKVGFTSEGSKVCWFQIHQLVMRAFVGPCPAGMEVRHLDSNPANNTLPNLAYGTRKENARDRVLNGTDNNARKTHCPTCELPYDEANTYWYKGARQCKNCRARRAREQIHVPSADLSSDELEHRRALARERARRYNERKRQSRCSEDGDGTSESDIAS